MMYLRGCFYKKCYVLGPDNKISLMNSFEHYHSKLVVVVVVVVVF